ncbi:MAG: hypothetical protein JST89_20695 [Cyanobacteria bacterium SZAS-4]|nr:hypothetical protein [Cyanobacteria bacterium SZAS-4]
MENDFARAEREARVFVGGAVQGAIEEAWSACQNPTKLAGTIATDALLGAGAGAMFLLAPEVAPALAVVALGGAVLNNINPTDAPTKARNARLQSIFSDTWNNTDETQCRNRAAHELGVPTFDFALATTCGGLGFKAGKQLVTTRIEQAITNELKGLSVMSKPMGESGVQTRIGDSTVTTFSDGKVVKQHDSGYIARYIPTEDGRYIVTERTPSGTLSFTAPDGTRVLETSTGRTYSFEPDGSHDIMRPTGLRLQVNPDGTKIYTHSNGIQTRFDENGKTRSFK